MKNLLVAFIAFTFMGCIASMRTRVMSIADNETDYELSVQANDHNVIVGATVALYKRGVGEYRQISSSLIDLRESQEGQVLVAAMTDRTFVGYHPAWSIRFRLPRGTQFALALRVTESHVTLGSTQEIQVAGTGTALPFDESTNRAVRLRECTTDGACRQEIPLRLAHATVLSSPTPLRLVIPSVP